MSTQTNQKTTGCRIIKNYYIYIFQYQIIHQLLPTNKLFGVIDLYPFISTENIIFGIYDNKH